MSRIMRNREIAASAAPNGRTGDRTPRSTAMSAVVVDPPRVRMPRASLATLDAFRMLALNIDNLMSESELRSIVILSANAGDGRTLTAELLTLALRDLRPPVRLLDADPLAGACVRSDRRRQFKSRGRRRTSGVTLTVPTEIVLSDETMPAPVPDYGRIAVAKEMFANHGAFVRNVERALDAAVAEGATVVIDVPACSTSSVAFAVARLADAALCVVRASSASTDVHREIAAQADLLDIRLLGAVVNEG